MICYTHIYYFIIGDHCIKMEALLFDKKNLKLIYKSNCEIPKLDNDNDVLVQVEYSGICGTDVHIIHGDFPCEEKRPFVMGHEFVGVVMDAGKKAHFKSGQRVVIDPNSGCNVCNSCHIGDYHLCSTGGINNTIGIFRDGGWAKYCKVPDTQVLLLPDAISPEQAALTEPLSCLAHGWDRVGSMYVGENILVVGAGIIGLLWAQVLHLRGHRNVTIVEVNPDRLRLARNIGSNYDCKTPTEVEKSTKKFDVIIDCTGVAKALESSISLLNPAGRYVVFGCCNPKDYIKVNPFEISIKEISIIGVMINPFTFPKSLGLLEAMGSRYMDYEALGIAVFPLAKYEDALEKLKLGAISKAIFKF